MSEKDFPEFWEWLQWIIESEEGSVVPWFAAQSDRSVGNQGIAGWD
jgi:hypothetical protein